MPFSAKVITTSEWGARPPKAGEFPFKKTVPLYVIVHNKNLIQVQLMALLLKRQKWL